jgi:hypothetical protein
MIGALLFDTIVLSAAGASVALPSRQAFPARVAARDAPPRVRQTFRRRVNLNHAALTTG